VLAKRRPRALGIPVIISLIIFWFGTKKKQPEFVPAPVSSEYREGSLRD
jgi:hypothetical protein